jgi:hypothetical protein
VHRSNWGHQLTLFRIPASEHVVNVASVPQRSPFRYPGGKTWLIPRVRQWLRSLEIRPTVLVEPFAGGGIVGLTTAFEELAAHVVLLNWINRLRRCGRPFSVETLTGWRSGLCPLI